jgi:transcriptional regulator with XRE-family HTH domain
VRAVTAQTWGEWVKQQLDQRGWNYARAATESGLPPSAISQWVNRPHQEPSLANIRKLADALGIPILTALVAAGYITSEEAGQPPAPPVDAAELSTLQLLEEIKARVTDHLDELDPQPPGRNPQPPLRPNEVADVAFYNGTLDQTDQDAGPGRTQARP